MTAKIKKEIHQLIENGFAETKVYYTQGEMWRGEWERGACAQIAAPYGGTSRTYAPSYAELLEALQDEQDARESMM